MVMVHAESDGMIKWITSRLLDAELRTPKYHGVARHALAEREATHRAITFAEFVGVCKRHNSCLKVPTRSARTLRVRAA